MIELDADQREILQRELRRVMPSLAPATTLRHQYQRLSEALGAGAIPQELMGPLEQVLEMMLSTSRPRRVYGPAAEQALIALYQQTPAGIRLRQLVDQVNRSLTMLKAQRIERLSFSLKRPGAYQLTIETDQCELLVSIGRDGVSVDQLSIGV